MEPKKYDALVARWRTPPRRSAVAAPVATIARHQEGAQFMAFMSAVNSQ